MFKSPPALTVFRAERARGAVVAFRLPAADVARLRALARREGATLLMALLATYGLVLARHAGQREVVVGTPVANRAWVEVEPLVGYFTNVLALRAAFGAPEHERALHSLNWR